MGLDITVHSALLGTAPQACPEDMAQVAQAGFVSVMVNRPDFEGGADQPTAQAVEAAARAQGRHLVLSGRNAPDWLVEAADLVTSMTEIKHPWRTGIKAAPGIEF